MTGNRLWIRLALLAGLACLALSMACARVTPISEIRANEAQFMNQPVTVRGTVKDTMKNPLGGGEYYKLDDGSGELWVTSGTGMPALDTQVRVTGTLKPGFSFGRYEAGMVVHETKSVPL